MTLLVVLNAITAEIKKQDGSFDYEFGNIWDDGNVHALNFVKEIENKFRRKSKTYGFLNIDKSKESIPSILTSFNADTESHFLNASQRMMNRLKSSLNEDGRGNTHVGHIVIIHFRNDGEDDDLGRLLIVMVDKKNVFDFGDGLVPKQFNSIDVDALRQAVRYDLTLFDSVYPDHVQENQDQAYLHFISGKSTGHFFQEALGTHDIIDNTVSISSIFDAINAFGLSINLRVAHIRKLTEEVELLIQSKKGKQISINSVAKKIISNLPDNVDNMTAEDFLTFVNENEYKISEVFDVTRGQLQKATNIEGQKGQDYFYRVKRTALGSMRDIDKSIRYDVETRTLYIDVLDEDKHKELMAAISSEE